jgi:hypothetical protein
MSNNQGKDGEMRFAIAIAGASIRENSLDFTRHSVTNQSDLGVDYTLQGKAETLINFCETAAGTNLPMLTETLGDPTKTVEGRVDVKTMDRKLTNVEVNKFIADIKKHPNTELHILAGGTALTKTAQKNFNSQQTAFRENGKALEYISNTGIRRLANEYKPEILSALEGPVGSKSNPSDHTEK